MGQDKKNDPPRAGLGTRRPAGQATTPELPPGDADPAVPPPQVLPGELASVFGAVGTPPLILTTRATAFGDTLVHPMSADSGNPHHGQWSKRGTAFRLAGRRFRLGISALMGVKRYGLAGLVGLGAGLAMAPFYILPLLPVAFIALVWLLDGTDQGSKGGRQAFAIGWAFGFTFFLAGLYWIGFSFLVEAETYAWMMPFAVIAMPVGLGLFTGGALFLAKILWRPGVSRIFIFAAAFAGFEWLRGHVFTGFPWNLTGYAWGGVLDVMQSLSVIGIYGLSFLTVLVMASPAVLFAHPNDRGNWRWPFFAVLVIAVLWTAGAARIYLAPTGPDTYVPGMNLRIVQPNIPQADKWLPQNRQAIWDRMLAQTAASASAPITHVIWPENAVPFMLAGNPGQRAEAGAVMGEGVVLITGAYRVEREPGGTIRFFNGFHVMDSGGDILATYDKHHLVPFGEYLPFRSLLERFGFQQLVALREGGVIPTEGPGPRTLSVPGAPDMGPLICYEVIFPGEVVDLRRRPGWLVNVTNDSWFGDSTGPRQHLGLAQARAIEEGLPLVRAANTGISAVIDPYGRILSRLELNQFGVIDSPLPHALPPTIYAYVRDWPFIFAVLLILAIAWLRPRRG